MTLSLAVDQNNDIFLAPNGNLAGVAGIDAVLQNCQTAMQAQRGEMIYALADGMPSQATAFDTYNPQLFEAAGRSVLSRVDGVVSVLAFGSAKIGNTLQYSATIQTSYGVGLVSSSATSAGNILDYNFILDESLLG